MKEKQLKTVLNKLSDSREYYENRIVEAIKFKDKEDECWCRGVILGLCIALHDINYYMYKQK